MGGDHGEEPGGPAIPAENAEPPVVIDEESRAATVRRWESIAHGGFHHFAPAPDDWPGGLTLVHRRIASLWEDWRLVAHPKGSPVMLRLEAQPGADFTALRHLEPDELLVFGRAPMYTAIRDDDLRYIADQSRLVNLDLLHAPVGDAAIASLGSLPNLDYLSLYGTRITDYSLPLIARWSRLSRVNLGGTKIVGETLSALRALPRLRSVDLRNTKITEEAVLQLQGIPTLEWIDIDFLGWGARRRLQRAMPEVDFR